MIWSNNLKKIMQKFSFLCGQEFRNRLRCHRVKWFRPGWYLCCFFSMLIWLGVPPNVLSWSGFEHNRFPLPPGELFCSLSGTFSMNLIGSLSCGLKMLNTLLIWIWSKVVILLILNLIHKSCNTCKLKQEL